MSVVIPPNFGLAAWVFTSNEGTSPFVCTMGVTLPEDGPEPVTVADVLFDRWADTLSPIMDSDMTLNRVTLTVGSVGPTGSVDSGLSPVPGGRSTTGLPWSLAAIARKNTALIGRRGRGRMFIPAAVSNSEIGQNGAISTARLGAINTALASFHDRMTDEDYAQPVLLHNQASALVVPTLITSLTCAPLCGWVRKRIR